MVIQCVKKNKKMAGKLDNQFSPKYIPSYLKWYERDGLDTWYLEGKCKDFLEDTDACFVLSLGNFLFLA